MAGAAIPFVLTAGQHDLEGSPCRVPPPTVVAAELASLGPDDVLAYLVPHQHQGDRARALDHHGAVLAELRAAGWDLTTGVTHTPNGEVFWLAPIAPPKESPDLCP